MFATTPATLAAQLSDSQIDEWCLMDTHDMLITTYDSPQRPGAVEGWFRAEGFDPERRPRGRGDRNLGSRTG